MIKVAGVQMFCSEDKERNVEKAVRLAQIAAEKGAQIICFQELFTTHWFPKEMDRKHFTLAENLKGPSLGRMREVARAHEIAMICPFFEEGKKGAFTTPQSCSMPEERFWGRYRKIHVPQIPLWEEKYYFAPGNLGFPVFHTKFAAVGIQVCWDNFFPEGSRILALKGAQIIFSPTAAAFASQRRWEAVISGNAISNGVFVFRVNRVGSEEKQDFYGKSFCASPEGEMVDRPTGMKEGIALVEIDLGDVERVRREWSFFKDRRPETYGEILGEREF